MGAALRLPLAAARGVVAAVTAAGRYFQFSIMSPDGVPRAPFSPLSLTEAL